MELNKSTSIISTRFQIRPNQMVQKSEVFQLFIESIVRMSSKYSHLENRFFVCWNISLVTLDILHAAWLICSRCRSSISSFSDSEVVLAVQNLRLYVLVQSTVTFRLWWQWWLWCWGLRWWWLMCWWCLNCLFSILSKSFLVPVPDRFLFFCLGFIFGLLSSYPTIWI